MWKQFRLRLCEISVGRKSTANKLEELTPTNGNISTPSRSHVASVADDLASGRLAPEHCGIEVRNEVKSETQHDPWHTLRDFLKYVEDTRRRLGLRLSRKKTDQAADDTQGGSVACLPDPQASDEAAVSQDTKSNLIFDRASSNTNHHKGLGTVDKITRASSLAISRILPEETPVAARRIVVKEDSMEDSMAIQPEPVFLAEEDRKAKEKAIRTIHTGSAPSRSTSRPGSLNIATSTIPDSDAEDDDSEVSNMIANPSDSVSTGDNARSYSSMTKALQEKEDLKESFCTAGMIQLPNGEWKPVKLHYDTQSPCNFVAQKFVNRYGLIMRPIKPENTKKYMGLGGKEDSVVEPEYYVEMGIQDEDNDIKDPYVSFNVVDTLQGRGLLIGTGFLNKYKFRLMKEDAKYGSGVYPVTGRESSDGKEPSISLQRVLLICDSFQGETAAASEAKRARCAQSQSSPGVNRWLDDRGIGELPEKCCIV